ncbi:lactonase family protein [Paraburkholderia sp. Tr-20389]|uniref:lactonase family protein n=1 Tax=Paraburkholderia sp. Tr-20389 TaxID=2703903 RepID=UPI0019819E6A|nr:lactonase family protein [Paraburkholderia sp. Tr-20389]MBN3752344.1 lactonase family protein [Paraburkholderia sp. Tr-20389]
MIRSLQRNRLTRYGFAVAFVALTVWTGMIGGCKGISAQRADTHTDLVYVGTQDSQIHALRFDPSTGKLNAIGVVATGTRSTWVTSHPQLPVLYAVDDDNSREGSVTAYAVNRATGALTKVDAVLAGGTGTTNLLLDTPATTLLAANYGSGSVSSIVVHADGSLGPLVSTVKETGSGPNRRQASAHAHSAVIDPSGRYVLVPDFGADRVFIYGFQRATHALATDDEASPHAFAVAPGSGPRHLAFGSNGQFVYLLTELSAELMVLRWDDTQGRLTLIQTLPVSSDGFKGVKSGAEIAVSRDGRFIYVENRAENELIVYRVNGEAGTLSLIQRTSSGGDKPWGFAIHPSGKWMFVANQRSGKVNVFAIDPASGKLSDTGESADMPTPVAIDFVR